MRTITVGQGVGGWRKRAGLIVAAAASVLVVLGGCAGIPQQELNAYVASVGEAKKTGQTMLADWRSARAEFERREAKPTEEPKAPIALELPPPADGALSAEDAREYAWEAIALYTETLARLNAGESVEDVRKVTGRLVTIATRIAGSAVPGISELGSLLQDVVAELERARLAAEFKKGVQKGAPIIQRMIREVFIPDANSHYTLRAALASEDHGALEVADGIDDEEKRLRQTRIVDETKSLAASIVAYRQLLMQTDRALEELRVAVEKPVDLAAQTDRLLDLALRAKRHWQAYENAKREGRD
jgi:hypothetical protein